MQAYCGQLAGPGPGGGRTPEAEEKRRGRTATTNFRITKQLPPCCIYTEYPTKNGKGCSKEMNSSLPPVRTPRKLSYLHLRGHSVKASTKNKTQGGRLGSQEGRTLCRATCLYPRATFFPRCGAVSHLGNAQVAEATRSLIPTERDPTGDHVGQMPLDL